MATAIAERHADPVVVFRQTLATPAFREQLKMALPTHISPEKFERVCTTAVQANPSLLDPQKVERRSLFGALVRAAQDGLLPDGREGAIVPFKGKAQWMPMVAGIMVKVRRSGEIATWDAFPVYEKDEFDYLLGDRPQIHHRPFLDGDPGQVVGAYSVVTFKDGTVSKDYLPRWRIEKARNQNPVGKNSLMWTTFYEEGAVKTVIRHHAKRLPQSTDIEAIFERDETMPPAPETLQPANDPPASRLDALEAHIGADAINEPEPEEIEAEVEEISTAAAGLEDGEAEPETTAEEAAASAEPGDSLFDRQQKAFKEGAGDQDRGEKPALADAKAAIDKARNADDAVAVQDSYRGQLSDEDYLALSTYVNNEVARRWPA
jgi:recombination protein RecT